MVITIKRREGEIMGFTRKDRTLIAASSLVGYCMSVTNLPFNSFSEEEHRIMKGWADGLLNAAMALGKAVDAAIDETEPGDGSSEYSVKEGK